MPPLLYLTHRIPYPPNKGDKVRSFHLLEHLAQHYEVHLGSFVDTAFDLQYVQRVGDWCASTKIVRLHGVPARLRGVGALLRGTSFSVAYYRNAALAQWVRSTVRAQRIERVVVFSSVMAQYVSTLEGIRVVIDFVDVDSAKWSQFAQLRAWPLSAIFEREGMRLRAYESKVAAGPDRSAVFVSESERALFCASAPDSAKRTHALRNGVDADFFSPWHELASPFGSDEEAIVFTGAMDYWPNIDAVRWFAEHALPAVAAARPNARLHIVGMRPSRAVKALAANSGIVVTGAVPDIRPYLRHARVVIAPMRIARGIQNKVLEAMAMGCAVVVSQAATASLGGRPGVEYEVAGSAEDFIAKCVALIERPSTARNLGVAARERVLADWNWERNLAPFLDLLNGAMPASGHGIAPRCESMVAT